MADKSARPAPGDEMIILENLYKRFGHVVAVGGVNLRIARGEVVVIVGPSGSGKSTVLRCINLLEVPTEGDVWVDGFHLTAKKPAINSVREEVGMVFQQFNLFNHLTALENVMLAQRLVRKTIEVRGGTRRAWNSWSASASPRRPTCTRATSPEASNSASRSRVRWR